MEQSELDPHLPSSLAEPPTVPPTADPQLQPAEPEPWPSADRPRHQGGHSDSQTFRIAFLAALTATILTAATSFVLFKATMPDVAVLPTSSSPATVVASGAASVAPTPTVPAATAAAVIATGSASLDTGSAIVAATAKATPSVVTITTETSLGRRSATGVGSGFLFDNGGWILTNGHVVDGASSVTVELADGRQLTGQVYGIASSIDLAVVKVEATGLRAAAIGNSHGLALGQTVIAIGSPLGEYPDSVTTGVVSGLNRSIVIRGIGSLEGLIQTDAAINPGNSGGPLLDTMGRVVGVATATNEAAQGISFAIPIDAARSIMAEALAGQPIN
jgi:S1-C subfamily serine protease